MKPPMGGISSNSRVLAQVPENSPGVCGGLVRGGQRGAAHVATVGMHAPVLTPAEMGYDARKHTTTSYQS